MITVEFLGPIGIDPLHIDAVTFDELSSHLNQNEEIAFWLPVCAVAINDTLISDRSMPLNDGDRVSLLPPVCGG